MNSQLPRRAPATPDPRLTVAPDPFPCVVIKLGRQIERRLQRALKGSGINATQLAALLDIARRPGISRAALARELQVTPQAVARVTAHLLDDGLIIRTIETPGRPTQFNVTPRGFRLIQQAAPALASAHRDLLGPFLPKTAEAVEVALRARLTTPSSGGGSRHRL